MEMTFVTHPRGATCTTAGGQRRSTAPHSTPSKSLRPLSAPFAALQAKLNRITLAARLPNHTHTHAHTRKARSRMVVAQSKPSTKIQPAGNASLRSTPTTSDGGLAGEASSVLPAGGPKTYNVTIINSNHSPSCQILSSLSNRPSATPLMPPL